MMTTKNPIFVESFSKNYGALQAVDNISLAVKPGELFGLIGPDGAGKTTLIRTLCTLLKPSAGKLWVEGMEVTEKVAEIRGLLGYMPQRFSLYPDLTVAQNIRFFADIFEVPREEIPARSEKLYKFSRLKPFRQRKAGELSGGMKQKLALSCALIHTPAVLILDEPTFGVDPLSRQEFWEILKEIVADGATILVSTAYMEEADLCDRVALMHRGKILSTDTPENIKKKYRYPLYRISGRDVRSLNHFFKSLPEVHSTQLFGDSIHAGFKERPEAQRWSGWVAESGQNLTQWEPISPSIEDVFMEFIREEKK